VNIDVSSVVIILHPEMVQGAVAMSQARGMTNGAGDVGFRALHRVLGIVTKSEARGYRR
jgi:hypothetical protein